MAHRRVGRPFAMLLCGAILTAIACGSTSETFVNPTSPNSPRCQPTLSSPATSFGPTGGTGSVTVTVARECEWSATVSASWIIVTAGAEGQGDGTIAYRVSENIDPTLRRAAI